MTASDHKYTCVPPSTDPEKGDRYHVRYVLKPTNPAGTKPLFAIGLNPSAAYEKELDPTVANVEKFAEKYKGGRHFVMFNLCPQRTPNPKDLQKMMEQDRLDGLIDIDALQRENIAKIKQELDAFAATEKPTIFACWGEFNVCQQYFRNSLLLLLESIPEVDWVRISTKDKDLRYPMHPSLQNKNLGRWEGDYELVEWKPSDVEKYFAEIKTSK
jgi:hypothetical protein